MAIWEGGCWGGVSKLTTNAAYQHRSQIHVAYKRETNQTYNIVKNKTYTNNLQAVSFNTQTLVSI